MRSLPFFLTLLLLTGCSAEEPPTKTAEHLYQLGASNLEGESVSLSDYKGQVCLVVNVASRCGFTGQYEGLEKLYRQNKDRGFTVLAFPCNDFGGQEPGSANEIREFCTTTYDVTFPLFGKVHVVGAERHPVYSYLATVGETPSWNFGKYLVDREGRVLAFYGSMVKPGSESLQQAIDRALAR